MQTLTPIDPNS